MVLEADGLEVAFFRSVLSTIHLLARGRHPNDVFRDLGRAIEWACDLPGQRRAVIEARPQLEVEFRRALDDFVADAAG